MSYSVLIVDDEKKIRDRLLRHVEWESMNFNRPLQASGGLEALELMHRTPVDLLITDVKMPRMDGLELAERVCALSRHTAIVILSGFSEFEYAKKAMAFGVKHYLTKPTDLNQLHHALQSVCDELEQRDRQDQRLKVFERKYREALDVMLGQYMSGLARGASVPEEAVRGFLQEHRTELPYRAYSLLAVRVSRSAAGDRDGPSLYRAFRRSVLLHPLAVCPFFIDSEELLFALVNYDDPAALQSAAAEIAEQFGGMQPAWVAVSASFGSLRDMAASYRQLTEMADRFGRKPAGGVHLYAEFKARPAEGAAPYPQDLEKRLLASITAGNGGEAGRIVRGLFEPAADGDIHPEAYRERFAKLFFAMEEGLREFQIDSQEIGGERIYPLKKAREFRDPREMGDWLADWAERCIRCLHDRRVPVSVKFVEQIKAYIEAHYMDDITLQSTSEAIHLSPAYIGKMFKKATGSNFVEYLTEVRMRHAKLLLADFRIRIYEIVGQVGYASTKHFSQVFKACTGLTPTEYRDRVRMEGAEKPE